MNKYKIVIENLGDKRDLSLKDSNIIDDDITDLAEALRHTQITELDLSNNKIQCSGFKCLANALKDTQITTLNLSKNKFESEGMRHLAKVLKDTKITHLDLTGNKINFQAAIYFNEMVKNTTVNNLYLDVYCAENVLYVYQRSYCDINNVHIELHESDIGLAGSEYINKSFRKRGIQELNLNFSFYDESDVHYLSQAFIHINIGKLTLTANHFTQPGDVEKLVQIFKKSQIGLLNLAYKRLPKSHIRYLAEFLKRTKILELALSWNRIGDESIKVLAPALKNSDVMKIYLDGNTVTSEGARYLSEILRDSKILYIGLCNCDIGIEGAKYLANGLPHSQVTSIHLHGNGIGYEGYQTLISTVNETNISWVNLHGNNIEAGMNGEKLWPYNIPRDTTPISYYVTNAFKGLVESDLVSDQYEFIIPNDDNRCYPPMDIHQYAFLIGTLKDTPNSKVHIFEMVNEKYNYDYDFVAMNKIDDFIANITEKFISFFESKLPDLITKFADDDYVGLVKKFEKLRFYDIVQSLLLHRVLYYVDENQEILHPYIYKLLKQYNLPLYNSQLEPNKKDQIISYYESHHEIDGVQEIIDLLKSNSL